jgi:hypothetical protein
VVAAVAGARRFCAARSGFEQDVGAGIGQTLATVIFLETGPIERFAEVGNFASYALRRQRAHQQSQEER